MGQRPRAAQSRRGRLPRAGADDSPPEPGAAQPPPISDRLRRERIIAAQADQSDADWLRRRLESATEQRLRRLAERDAAIKSLWCRFWPHAGPTVAARAVAGALDRYLSGLWRRDRDAGLPDGASELRGQLLQIASLNAGRPLGWRQILNLLNGGRGR